MLLDRLAYSLILRVACRVFFNPNCRIAPPILPVRHQHTCISLWLSFVLARHSVELVNHTDDKSQSRENDRGACENNQRRSFVQQNESS